ncbi:MAG: hypothetical protein IT178_17635, partial [Acidobacteria bacterium]|nr:hypothetical protein [Acidobacteriota bacterium]
MPDLLTWFRQLFGSPTPIEAPRRVAVARVASSRLPTEWGAFDIHVYETPGASET